MFPKYQIISGHTFQNKSDYKKAYNLCYKFDGFSKAEPFKILSCKKVEDFMENKKFPEAMQFYHQYPIRTKNGDIFTEPGMINYTIEFRDPDGKSQYKEVFIHLYLTFLAKKAFSE